MKKNMPDDEEELKPKNSLCNTCKFGLCLEENEIQTFVHPAIIKGNEFESESEQPGVNQVSFPMNKVRSVCFWRPQGLQTGMIAPLVFNCVTECSRHESN